jgi:hypothetical protein
MSQRWGSGGRRGRLRAGVENARSDEPREQAGGARTPPSPSRSRSETRPESRSRDSSDAGVCGSAGTRSHPRPSDSRFLEFRSVSGFVLCSLPDSSLRLPSSRLELPLLGGGRLLLAAAAALESLDDGAAWAALFGASLEEATGDRVAYPAAFACASLPSHGLKVLEASCSFNSLLDRRVIALRDPPKRTLERRTGYRQVAADGPHFGGSALASCDRSEDGPAVTGVSLSVGLGLICALLSALGTNLAFLFNYKGAVAAPDVDMRHPLRSAVDLFRSRWWSIGWGVAAVAFALHVAAPGGARGRSRLLGRARRALLRLRAGPSPVDRGSASSRSRWRC